MLLSTSETTLPPTVHVADENGGVKWPMLLTFPSWKGSTVSLLLFARLLRAQPQVHARFEDCPPGQLTAISESGVFGSAVPARLCLAPHPAGGNLVRPLACVPAPSVGSLGPEYPSDSTLSLGSSTIRDTCVSPVLVPSARSRERGWRRGRSDRCRCDGHRHGRRFQQLFARPASNPPPRGAEDHGAILQALPSRPVSEQS